MSELSTSADSDPPSAAWDNVDLLALENRLNQLGGDAQTPHEVPRESLLDRFLAEESQTQLSNRSQSGGENDGPTETVTHYARVPFQRGQTRAVIHIPFQPDLIAVPDVDANLVDATGRTRITDVTKFGVRIELQLSKAPQQSVKICVESVCTAKSRE